MILEEALGLEVQQYLWEVEMGQSVVVEEVGELQPGRAALWLPVAQVKYLPALTYPRQVMRHLNEMPLAVLAYSEPGRVHSMDARDFAEKVEQGQTDRRLH